MSATQRDALWMWAALAVARRGAPAPNPRVGTLVVTGERLIAAGWHERAGGPHAEVVALRAAGEKARGATLYVTLEPCTHYGRTPPCVDAILAAGVARVVYGCRDPNPHVRGGGARRLQEAGLEVRGGVLGAAARRLVAAWRASLGLGETFGCRVP
jgi:diaminohydroxyphosphoribosylaminopyrimidine deaminase/5-amino-6-(5-phosphoribosylamino)uracil reductase